MAEGHSKLKTNPAPSQVRVKEEEDRDSREGHPHHFKFQLGNAALMYRINCDHPCTVLEALKTSEKYTQKCSDENIVIQLGEADKEIAVATHFPSHLIGNDELLVIFQSKKVEEAQRHHQAKPSQSSYVQFYIDRDGGQGTKSKKLFISNAIRQFKYLCVYAEKGITVEEALKRDGRFINNLGKFTLSENADPNCRIERTQQVGNLDGKKFKICLPHGNTGLEKELGKERAKVSEVNKENQQANQGASHDSQHSDDKSEAKPILDVKQRGRSVNTDHADILNILRKQFPALKKWMESRFPGDSYQKALNLRREDFGKIQQSFSEFYRIRQLLALGQSVCKVIVEGVCEGTGFILFDNFILTNAHLVKECVVQHGDKWQISTDVYAVFNFEKSGSDYYNFKVKKTITACNFQGSACELDYAIFELDHDTRHDMTAARQTVSAASQTKRKSELPPGLLKKCGPVPVNGEACIIGHPAGNVKIMDPTCIIEKERREEAANNSIETFKGNVFTLVQTIKDQGIEHIMQGGSKVDKVVTYNTCLYHGSSGSPVFDAHCRVFGLHSAGFYLKSEDGLTLLHNVIEYAYPLIAIFKNFVIQLKESKNPKVLERVKKEVENNLYLKVALKEALESISDDEPMETD